MKPSTPAVLLASLLLAGGCEPEASGTGAPATTRPSFEIAAEPSLEVGVLEGDPMEQFDRVVSPFLLPAGSLAVPTGGAASIRIFSADGTFLESLGGPGEGPGEIAFLEAAWARGDTIEVWDSRARRVTRFLPGGGTEVVRLQGGDLPLDGAVGPLGDGWAVLSMGFGDGRDRVAVESFSRSGEHRGTVTELRGMARHFTADASGPHPISPTALAATHGDEVYALETDEPIVHIHGPEGEARGEIRLPLEAVGAPPEVLARVVDTAVARASEGEAERVRARLSTFPEPEAVPLVQGLFVDDRGLLWIRPWDPDRHALALGGRPDGRPGPGGEWLVVDRSGALVTRVEMAPDLEPLAFGSDAIVGVRRDELDVESVRVHPLTRHDEGGR